MKRKFVAIQPGLKCWLYNAVPACGARKQLKPLSTTDNSHLPRELPWTQMPEHAGFLHTGCMTGHWEPSANENYGMLIVLLISKLGAKWQSSTLSLL